jgi:inosine-uridine nucleoside N-ribohydrolase
VAESGTGIRPVAAAPDPRDAVALIAEHARVNERLVVVALGPLTNLADLADARPEDYRRLAGVHAMGGSVAGPLADGVAEWNAAADPDALAAVLAAPAPLTLVPEDAIP